MTVLFGSAQQVGKAHGQEALALQKSKAPKYHLRAGAQYLHFSATKLTDKLEQAWSGNIDHVRACRAKFAETTAGLKAIRTDLTPLPTGEGV